MFPSLNAIQNLNLWSYTKAKNDCQLKGIYRKSAILNTAQKNDPKFRTTDLNRKCYGDCNDS